MNERRIDRLIREAQERGEFENLPGLGKPIPGLDRPYDELWWVKQLLERENLSLTPAGLELKRGVEKARDAVARAGSEAAVRRILEDLNRKIGEANARARSGPASDVAPVDVDEAIARWRARGLGGSGGGPGQPA